MRYSWRAWGRERFEDAYQRWLSHWKATESYSPHVEANMADLMGEAVEKLCAALTAAGIDVLSRHGPQALSKGLPPKFIAAIPAASRPGNHLLALRNEVVHGSDEIGARLGP